ncbi:MAG TPA: hypothetical protein RMH99_00355 [Sandaracinaceae bacterium LLY-WYZ-13_1]|nr:hypothetical protein [Sandaracinaceae bacterium LLY-WYZ-13_1]
MKNLSAIFRPLTRSLPRVALAAGLAGAIGLAAPVTSFAQTADAPRAEDRRRGHGMHHRGHHHRGHARRGMRHVLRQLDLSDAQREEIRSLVREARSQARDAEPERRRALRRQVRARIGAILTPEQRERARQLRAERRQRRIARRVSRMSERLELSERQQQQVRGILRHAASQREALREQGANDPESARTAMQALRERTRESIRSVLNAEQQARLDEMRARRDERRVRRGPRGPRGPRGAR